MSKILLMKWRNLKNWFLSVWYQISEIKWSSNILQERFGYALYVHIAKDVSFHSLETPLFKGSLLVSYGFVVLAFFSLMKQMA